MNDDDELMIRIQAGDARAFDELVQRYQGQLIGFFQKNCRDHQLAEDLTQETLLRVHKESWDYLPTGRFRGWVFRIARNLLIDNVRRQSHDALVHAYTGSHGSEFDALGQLIGDFVPPEQIADQRDFARLIDELLIELPAEQRVAFTMHVYGGLTLSEIAIATEVSLPTAKSRLRLSKEKLRQKLHERGFTLADEAEDAESAVS